MTASHLAQLNNIRSTNMILTLFILQALYTVNSYKDRLMKI